MYRDSQKIMVYHNFHLSFPICKKKEFKLFQLLEIFKKKIVLMHRPVAKDCPCPSIQYTYICSVPSVPKDCKKRLDYLDSRV